MIENEFDSFLHPVGDSQSLPSLVAEQIRLMISNGILKSGDKLIGEPEMAKKLNISRVTLREAVQILIMEGLLYRRRGVGTFVASKLTIENPLNRNTSVTEFIQSKGALAGMTDLQINYDTSNSYIAKMLNIQEDDMVISIHRIRTANSIPVIFSYEHFSKEYLLKIFGEVEVLDHLSELLSKIQSLNKILCDYYNVHIDHAIAKISALSADDFIAGKLGLKPGDCILRLDQVDYDTQNIPIMVSNEYYLGNSTFSVYRFG